MQDLASTVLVATAKGWRGGKPSTELSRATGAFLARAAQDGAMLARMSEALVSLDAWAAAWIAVACGTAVERGSRPELTIDGILALVMSWMEKLPRPEADGEAPPELTPGQQALLESFPFACQSAVAHLARLPQRREVLGRDVALLTRLEEVAQFSHGAIWVREALLKASGKLVLLHPTSGSGLRLRYENVSNCFHLFSLIQAAVGTRIEGGRAPSRDAGMDEAWWHYADGFSKRPEVGASLWGEGLTREIPAIDGVQVIVAWPPILGSRAWDAGFLGPHLDAMPANVEIEGEMSAGEVAAWLAKLGIDARRAAPARKGLLQRILGR